MVKSILGICILFLPGCATLTPATHCWKERSWVCEYNGGYCRGITKTVCQTDDPPQGYYYR